LPAAAGAGSRPSSRSAERGDARTIAARGAHLEAACVRHLLMPSLRTPSSGAGKLRDGDPLSGYIRCEHLAYK
jgi:hypothetical protein